MSFGGCDNLYKELWKACAGSLVDLPEVEDTVFYFPQGHLEQLEESIDGKLDTNLPRVNLPSEIPCRVLNVQLRADEDDEVFAQTTLLPIGKAGDLQLTEHPQSRPPQIPKPKFDSFFKVLGPSDINGHCRLHVPKRDAGKCLPPLDMSQQAPSQVLAAKDLRGTEWCFKHVFGGQPGRHLFTTGWSKFVASKGLVAGDTFIFLSGENGELRVGIRRLAHPYVSKPSSSVPSESMDGVLATACQAIATQSKFTVYYRPRKSPFIIGLNKYLRGVNHGFSLGTRFSMQFEGYRGTIIGVGEVDSMWQNSKWRFLKVCWDSSASITRPERISPWEIEPLEASFRASSVLAVESGNKNKRPRSQVMKRRKTRPKPDEKCMDDLGAMIKELPRPTVPSSESAGKRHDDTPHLVAVDACAGFYNDAGIPELTNEGYNHEKDPTIHDGTGHMRTQPSGIRSASSTHDITQPTFHGQPNRVPIEGLESGGQVEGIYVSDVAHSVLNSSTASGGSDSYVMAFLRDSPEPSVRSLLGEHPLPGDPRMHLQGTSTELPCSPKVKCTPTQIPFSGLGNGNERVNWREYPVAQCCVPILDRVMARYPATLSSFRAISDTLQSTFLEILAKVVCMLEQLTVGNMDMECLGNARRYLKDLKMSGIDMSWLEGRLNHVDGVCQQNILVHRREELAMKVAQASAKVRSLEAELSSVDRKLEEITSRIGTDPLSTDQSVIQGLL